MTDNSEDHRCACEARTVLSWPFSERRPYLELVERKRGLEGRKTLEQEIIRQNKIAKTEK